MSTHALHHDSDQISADSLVIRHVAIDAPIDWLRAGWRTMLAAPAASLLYGVLFALACIGVLLLSRTFPWFTLSFLTGLLLIGPFLASGLYVAARQHGEGERVNIRESVALLWDRRTNLSLFALFLGLIMAAWVRLAALLFAIQMDLFSPTSNSLTGMLSGHFDPAVTGYFVLIGAILAAAVFITSAVAIPLIVDRDAGPITAMQTSARAVASNWKPMLAWAGLIVALTGVGILSWFVGMVLLFPLLGYATWHSYRAVVGETVTSGARD